MILRRMSFLMFGSVMIPTDCSRSHSSAPVNGVVFHLAGGEIRHILIDRAQLFQGQHVDPLRRLDLAGDQEDRRGRRRRGRLGLDRNARQSEKEQQRRNETAHFHFETSCHAETHILTAPNVGAPVAPDFVKECPRSESNDTLYTFNYSDELNNLQGRGQRTGQRLCFRHAALQAGGQDRPSFAPPMSKLPVRAGQRKAARLIAGRYLAYSLRSMSRRLTSLETRDVSTAACAQPVMTAIVKGSIFGRLL